MEKRCYACNQTLVSHWRTNVDAVNEICNQLSRGYYELIEEALCKYVDFNDLRDLYANGEFKYVVVISEPGKDWVDVLRFYFKGKLVFTLQQLFGVSADAPLPPEQLQKVTGFNGLYSFRIRTKIDTDIEMRRE